MSEQYLKTHLESPLELSPFWTLQQSSVIRAINSKPGIKTNGDAIKELVYNSNFFKMEYNYILEEWGEDDLDSFKNSIKRAISCGLTVSGLITPLHTVHNNYMCRTRGCVNCAKYKALLNLSYPDTIIRYIMLDSERDAHSLTQELKFLFKAKKWDHLKVTNTKFWFERYMVRVSNIRLKDAGPFDNNEITASIKEFDREYPEFDTMTVTSNEDDRNVTYLTGTGVKVSIIDIYLARPHGKKEKESGSPKGWEYNYDTGEYFWMSVADRRKKKNNEDLEEGIVHKGNTPAVSVEGVSEEKLTSVVENALREESAVPQKPLFAWYSPSDIFSTNVRIVNRIRDGLTSKGHSQPSLFFQSKMTQSHIDEFNQVIGLTQHWLPDDLMDIEFTEDMLQPGLSPKLSVRARVGQSIIFKKAQDKIKAAPTFEELAVKIAREMLKLKIE